MMDGNMTLINNHRFRQLTFLGECIQSLRNQGRTWMMHIDSDEYVVTNPLLRNNRSTTSNRTSTELYPRMEPQVPTHLKSNALLDMLEEVKNHRPTSINFPCVSMPRLLYGSKESTATTISAESDNAHPSATLHQGTAAGHYNYFNKSKFETLRWKYHASLQDNSNNGQDDGNNKDDNRRNYATLASLSTSTVTLSTSLNGPPKCILDVSAIPMNDKLMMITTKKQDVHFLPTANHSSPESADDDDRSNDTRTATLQRQTATATTSVFSIHRPSVALCRSQSEVNFEPVHENPITVNHYIGSWERYMSRNDIRRSQEVRACEIPVRAAHLFCGPPLSCVAF